MIFRVGKSRFAKAEDDLKKPVLTRQKKNEENINQVPFIINCLSGLKTKVKRCILAENKIVLLFPSKE